MQKIVLHLENGDVLEFAGKLVSKARREVVRDGRCSTVYEYTLYEREDGSFILSLESYEKIRARSHRLNFRRREDAKDYVLGDADGEQLVRELFGDPTDD
jgi:hypothetical protein